jgi:hypothetical protein
MSKWFIKLFNFLSVLKTKTVGFLELNSGIRIFKELTYFQLLFFISILAFITYFNSLGIKKNINDENAIFKNDNILVGVKGVPSLLTEKYKDHKGPLASITFAIEQQLFGTKEIGFPLQYSWDTNLNGVVEPDEDTNADHIINAEDYMIRGIGVRHFNQLLIFILSVIAVFFLAFKYLLPEKPWWALIGLLIFITHPVNSQVVNDLTFRYLLLSFFFISVSLLFFFRWIFSDGKGNLILFNLFSFLAFLSSDYSLVLLLLIPILICFYLPEFFQSTNKFQRLIFLLLFLLPLSIVYLPSIKWIAFFILILIAGFNFLKDRLTLLGLSLSISLSILFIIKGKLFYSNGLSQPDLVAYYQLYPTFSELLMLKIGVFLKYSLLLIFPFSLVSDYSFSSISLNQFNWIQITITIVIVLTLISLTFVSIYRKNKSAVFFVYFLLFLIPFLNLFFFTEKIMSEPFLYHACFAFSFLLAALLITIVNFLNQKLINKIPSALILAFPFLFAFTTIHRNSQWKNESNLIDSDLKKVPDNANLLLNRALCYYNEATLEKNEKKRALLIQQSMIFLSHKNCSIYNKGLVNKISSFNYFLLNKTDSAIYFAKQVLINLPNEEEVITALDEFSKKETEKGLLFYQKGKLDSAEVAFNYSLKANDKNPDVYYNLAVISKQKGDTVKAINLLNSAITIKSKNEYLMLKKKLIKR